MTQRRDRQLAKREKRLNDMIGHRVRRLRLAADLTQSDLAQALGVSFQQVQKYEGGVSRLSAATLIGLCETLGVPAATLLDGLADSESEADRDWADLSVLDPMHRDLVRAIVGLLRRSD